MLDCVCRAINKHKILFVLPFLESAIYALSNSRGVLQSLWQFWIRFLKCFPKIAMKKKILLVNCFFHYGFFFMKLTKKVIKANIEIWQKSLLIICHLCECLSILIICLMFFHLWSFIRVLFNKTRSINMI